MNTFELKYGCNPNQTTANLYMDGGAELPFEILSGRPGYINFMDALNGWQLVSELKTATGLPAAASFKHVSPAGAAVGLPLSEAEKRALRAGDFPLTPVAAAYARARGADRMSSYGDFAALSDVCDTAAAKFLAPLVSDGIIAPGYEPEALEILRKKRKGNYNIIKINPDYQPDEQETRKIFGVNFRQGKNNLAINENLLTNIVTENKIIPENARRDMIIALITLKYTQSNSVAYAFGGQAVGIGAGQQSRIHCTRLAGQKADNFFLRQMPKVLELPFLPELKAADTDNATDLYIGEEWEDLLADGVWQGIFSVKPDPLTAA